VSGIESLLLTGLAVLLDATGLGSWRPDGSAYIPAEVGVCLDTFPASPDSVITLSDYVVSDDPSVSDSIIGVQVRTRRGGKDPRPVKDLDGAIFDLLHGMPVTTLAGGVKVVSCFRRSGTSLGADANQRWQRSSNYYMTVHRPSQNRS
jgi:hypothetical protein